MPQNDNKELPLEDAIDRGLQRSFVVSDAVSLRKEVIGAYQHYCNLGHLRLRHLPMLQPPPQMRDLVTCPMHPTLFTSVAASQLTIARRVEVHNVPSYNDMLCRKLLPLSLLRFTVDVGHVNVSLPFPNIPAGHMYRLWMCSISCTPDTMQAVQSTCNCHDACPVVPEGCLKDRPHVPPNESGVQGPIGPLPELPSRCTPPVLCDGVPIKHHLIPLCSQEMT